MKARIAVIAGDGIGPEVTVEAVQVLRAIGARHGHDLELIDAPFGGIAIDLHGDPLPPATLELCRGADAVLLGAIGGPKWSAPQLKVRPEQGLLRLRRELGVFANLRPVSLHPALRNSSPLKAEVLEGVDLVFVRELTGGIYFGDKVRSATGASDLCAYSIAEVERVVRVAARLAMSRRRRLLSIDKANVLETSRLWREVTERVVRSEFPQLQLEHMLVDAAAMHLIRRPRDFDVAVTENLFGDILTDEASMLAGSLGLLPSASLGEGPRGLYEPIHGSAPDIAGLGLANPIGAILSAALLLRHSLGLEREAAAVESAVAAVIDQGLRTPDIAAPGTSAASTRACGAAVIARLHD
ncbi:MAG: 3-isopropylmalate dehydrogenase [Gammaproteobacteria bacterium]|nr:3-isopropylmalate dehydrogenase [Gammaproteobacteria bacterium]MDE2252229.1 3-isopropylmalate dehydrogenase [Gammaproteobacteria bacterium]